MRRRDAERIDPGTAAGQTDRGDEARGASADRYEEFLRLFTVDRGRIFSYVFSLLPHHADAEDVFQRCSLLLWRKFDEFDREGSFLAWARGISYYEVCNFLRVAGRDRLRLRLDLDLVARLAEQRRETLEADEARLEALRGCLGKLKGPERDLVQQAYGDEGSIKGWAEATGRATQTLYNQLGQIRRKLFHCMRHSLAAQGWS